MRPLFSAGKIRHIAYEAKKRDFKKKGKNNMQCNVIRNGDVLTAETFPDLKKYLENNVVTLDSLIEQPKEWRINKLIIKDAKCNMPIKEIKHFLKKYLMLNELKEIEIASEDERFCTIDGMLYSKDKRRLYLCPCGREGLLVIPDGTDTITEGAFKCCNLSKVVVPDSVKQISGYAFERNYKLEETEGCKNVENIGGYAFSNCPRLKKFPFGKSIKGIGDFAFCGTIIADIYLPEGLSYVGMRAFDTLCAAGDGFEKLRMYDIHIPSTLKHIHVFAFANAANVYTSFVNTALIRACMGGGNLLNLNYYECNTWTLKVNGKPDVIMPKSIDFTSNATEMTSKINVALSLKSQRAKNNEDKDETITPPELYEYSSGFIGLSTALEQCRKYPNGNLRRYITKNINAIFLTLIKLTDSDGEKIIINLINDGVFTDTALKKLLKEIEQSADAERLTTLKAYALEAINRKRNAFTI